ncbi:hypothetical protein BC940DRAFT_343578 [Gongronella butleri]|nr:hypothetical protein BC940DRAFT_343578 [Gongronella butleri]
MPSARPVRRAKANVTSYKPPVSKAASKAAPKQPAPSKEPIIAITDASPPRDIVNASWRFLYIYQFLAQFHKFLNLPAIKLDTLESLLAADQPAEQLDDESRYDKKWARVLVPLLACVNADDRGHVTEVNFGKKLYSFFFNHSLDTIVQGVLTKTADAEVIDMNTLTVIERLYVLQDLVDHIFETGHGLVWRNEIQPEDMRCYPLGKDTDGWTYWLISDIRLYREIPGAAKKSDDDYTFELVAKDTNQWQEYMKKWSVKSKRPAERHLAEQLQEIGAIVVEKLEQRRLWKLKEEAKLERQRQYELIPKKRSRRIETKVEEDERLREKEEQVQTEVDLELLRLEQERIERDAQVAEDTKAMSIEEAKLRDYVHQLVQAKTQEHIAALQPNDAQGNAHWQQVRARMKKTATYEEIVDKLKDWTLFVQPEQQVYCSPDEPITYVDPNAPLPVIPTQSEQIKPENEDHTSDVDIDDDNANAAAPVQPQPQPTTENSNPEPSIEKSEPVKAESTSETATTAETAAPELKSQPSQPETSSTAHPEPNLAPLPSIDASLPEKPVEIESASASSQQPSEMNTSEPLSQPEPTSSPLASTETVVNAPIHQTSAPGPDSSMPASESILPIPQTSASERQSPPANTSTQETASTAAPIAQTPLEPSLVAPVVEKDASPKSLTPPVAPSDAVQSSASSLQLENTSTQPLTSQPLQTTQTPPVAAPTQPTEELSAASSLPSAPAPPPMISSSAPVAPSLAQSPAAAQPIPAIASSNAPPAMPSSWQLPHPGAPHLHEPYTPIHGMHALPPPNMHIAPGSHPQQPPFHGHPNAPHFSSFQASPAYHGAHAPTMAHDQPYYAPHMIPAMPDFRAMHVRPMDGQPPAVPMPPSSVPAWNINAPASAPMAPPSGTDAGTKPAKIKKPKEPKAPKEPKDPNAPPKRIGRPKKPKEPKAPKEPKTKTPKPKAMAKPKKPKVPKVYKRDLQIPFSHLIPFIGPGSLADLSDPMLRFILYVCVTHLRHCDIIADIERKSVQRRKRKVLPPLPLFYTIQRDLLLDRYKTSGGFQKWLDDMDEVFTKSKTEVAWQEAMRYAYNLFFAIFIR